MLTGHRQTWHDGWNEHMIWFLGKKEIMAIVDMLYTNGRDDSPQCASASTPTHGDISLRR